MNALASNSNRRIWQISIFDLWTLVSRMHPNFRFSKSISALTFMIHISCFDLSSKSEGWFIELCAEVWNLICRFAKLTHWLNGFAFNANKRIWQMSIFDVWTRVSQIHLNFCFFQNAFQFLHYDNISSFDLSLQNLSDDL